MRADSGLRSGQQYATPVMIVCALLPLWSTPMRAQIVDTPVTLGPPKAEHFMGDVPSNMTAPSSDPHDLNGNYVADLESGFGPKSDASVAPPAASASQDVSAQILCRPDAQLGVAPYGGQIIQTPGRVTIINEYNHVVRRIYLRRRLPTHPAPSYEGASVGHWEGNTLVIDTIALKSPTMASTPALASISQVEERLRKIDGGRRLDDQAIVQGVDFEGHPLTVHVSARMLWRPDVHLMEFICEDDGGQFFDH